MKRLAAFLALTSAATTPVHAGGGDVAAGLVGGLAAGTIIGAAVAGPRYYPPPPPVYVAPGRLAIGHAASRCGTPIGACGCTLASRFASRPAPFSHIGRKS